MRPHLIVVIDSLHRPLKFWLTHSRPFTMDFSNSSQLSIYHFNTDSAHPEKSSIGPPIDFIAFLAVAQRLQIPFLSITWQLALGLVGFGGTANINEALINLQTSLAFKRIDQEGNKDPSIVFRVLINEITALGHPSIQKHPNIVDLQGICWDIPSDDEVWPVLVFEKSHLGDLDDFAMQDLSINERLKLCVDIGTAIMDMHSNRREYNTGI